MNVKGISSNRRIDHLPDLLNKLLNFATDISSQNHFRRWVFDLVSPAVLEMAKRNATGIKRKRRCISICTGRRRRSFLKNMDGNLLNQDQN
mgnify:CR=1 FL=1